MDLVVDTSVLIAVLLDERERLRIIAQTTDADLVAPDSVHWEVGNALSAMMKKKRIRKEQLGEILGAYRKIPIRLVDVEMESALTIAAECNLYAYDAYLIQCAIENRCRLMSLDRELLRAAERSEVATLEVPS